MRLIVFSHGSPSRRCGGGFVDVSAHRMMSVGDMIIAATVAAAASSSAGAGGTTGG